MRSAIAGLRRTSVIGRDADGAWAIRRPVAEGFDCQVLAADPTLHPGRPTLPAWRNGRRDRLKICCPEGRGGSSPSAGTTLKNREKSRFFRIQAPSRAETNDTGNHLPVDLRRQLPTPHEANRPWNREGRSIHRRRARRTGPRNPRAIWVAPDPSAPCRPASRPPVHGAPGGLPRQAVPPGIGDGSHSNRPNSPHTACRCDG